MWVRPRFRRRGWASPTCRPRGNAMKLYAYYDFEGNVRSLVGVSAPEGAGLMLAPEPGQMVAEVEGITPKSDGSDVDKLSELVKTHKVPAPMTRCRLERKRQARKGDRSRSR